MTATPPREQRFKCSTYDALIMWYTYVLLGQMVYTNIALPANICMEMTEKTYENCAVLIHIEQLASILSYWTNICWAEIITNQALIWMKRVDLLDYYRQTRIKYHCCQYPAPLT